MLQCTRRYARKYFDSLSSHVIIVYKVPTPEVSHVGYRKICGKSRICAYCIKGYIKTFKVKHLIVTKSLADLVEK